MVEKGYGGIDANSNIVYLGALKVKSSFEYCLVDLMSIKLQHM